MIEEKCKYCKKTYSEFYKFSSDTTCQYCIHSHNSQLEILYNLDFQSDFDNNYQQHNLEFKKSRLCLNSIMLFFCKSRKK